MMGIKDEDFLYNGIEIDYRREYNCENSGCNDENICRCSYITDKSVESIDMTSIVNQIYSILFDESLSSKRNIILDKLLTSYFKNIKFFWRMMYVGLFIRDKEKWINKRIDEINGKKYKIIEVTK